MRTCQPIVTCHPDACTGFSGYNLEARAISILAIVVRCTSSGPSAMRSVRAAAHSRASTVSCTRIQTTGGVVGAGVCAAARAGLMDATKGTLPLSQALGR